MFAIFYDILNSLQRYSFFLKYARILCNKMQKNDIHAVVHVIFLVFSLLLAGICNTIPLPVRRVRMRWQRCRIDLHRGDQCRKIRDLRHRFHITSRAESWDEPL